MLSGTRTIVQIKSNMAPLRTNVIWLVDIKSDIKVSYESILFASFTCKYILLCIEINIIVTHS
jgi:hypothetical protein